MSDNIGYSMLIVDDEKLVRQKILRAVDCKKHNITNIEEAANGVEGLLQIMQNMPDIILLDICMPLMDGVEFASIVKKEHPSTQIIFITGFSDFKNMQSAIHAGANDYILKPVDSLSINEAILNAVTRLNQTVTAFPQITVPNPIDIIHSLMSSPSDILDERLRIVLHLPLDYECHIAVICNDFSLFDKWNEEDVHKFVQFSIINVANDILGQGSSGIAFISPNKEPALLLTCKANEIVPVLNEISRLIEELLEIELKFAISNGGSFSQISMLYSQAIEAGKHIYENGDPFFVFFKDTQSCNVVSYNYPSELEKVLCEKLFLCDASDYSGAVASFFQYIKSYAVDNNINRLFLMRLLMQISFSIDMYNNANSDSEAFNAIDPIAMVYYCTSLEMAEERVMLIFAQAHEHHKKAKDRKDDLFYSIDTYIRTHYSDCTLNMKKCSEELYLSYSYITRVLKRQIGKTFVEYLNEIRILEAKRQLQMPRARISETAIAVGFSHTSYFNVVFKKMTGVTPSQFRGESNEQ